MGTFYRGDIVADELNNKYKVETINDDDTVDLCVINSSDGTDGSIIEANTDVLHLVSRSLPMRLVSFFDRLRRSRV